jgi:Ser/Thr protein kinase RdoA (MazF antagonist)
MMKLSTMKTVLDTVDSGWRCPLANQILERWGYDEGTVFYWRASANFVFIFLREGHQFYLRFNEASEREVALIKSELDVVLYLGTKPLRTAQPILSLNGQFIETVESKLGTYHAVVFEAMPGEHLELEELDEKQFYDWGSALGQLHEYMKTAPEMLTACRPSWRELLEQALVDLPDEEKAARSELESCLRQAELLPKDKSNYGLIHYDFELDNHRWKDGEIGILDFDDCCVHWYAADIAYALGDLSDDGIDLSDHRVMAFIKGYKQETELDEEMLGQMKLFETIDELLGFAKLLRSVGEITPSDVGERLESLSVKLNGFIDKSRAAFESSVEG